MFDQYRWKYRLLIYYYNHSDIHNNNLKKLQEFISKNKDAVHVRKIIFLPTNNIDSSWILADIFNKNGFGFYLIGLDGQVKKFSKKISLLEELFSIIDNMPMRKSEIKNNAIT
jgi:hypothetical protein